MITPKEIEEKEFSKSMRGYNPEQVDEFLDQIIIDMEELLKEKEAREREIDALKLEIEQHKKSESSVMNTLESAKKLMKDISESAENRAQIIIKNAHLDAEVIQKDARDSVARLNKESQELQERVKKFRERYVQMLEAEMAHFSDSSDRFNDEFGDYIPASMDSELEDELTTVEELEALVNSSVEKKEAEPEEKDTHTILLNELFDENGASKDITKKETMVVRGPKEKSVSESVVKETIAIDSSDIEELLKKEEEKLKNKIR